MRRSICKRSIIFTLVLLVLSGAASNPLELGQTIDGAKDSVYTPKIVELIRSWPPSDLPSPNDSAGPFWLEAIRTAGNSSYIGLRKRIYVHAPLPSVSSALEDFTNYPSVHSEVQEVRVTEHGSNRWVTSWVRDRPAFFMPKIVYEQIYVSQEIEGRKFYRYEFKSGNAMNHSDGVIVLEPATDGTYVTSYDFFEGNFGIAKMFAESKIWKDSLEGYARADYELKIKSENPDWTFKQIQAQTDLLMEQFPFHGDKVRYADGLENPSAVLPHQ
jgi:hypothetical protein